MHQGSESNRQKCTLVLALRGGGNVREKLGTGDEGVKFEEDKLKVSTTGVSE